MDIVAVICGQIVEVCESHRFFSKPPSLFKLMAIVRASRTRGAEFIDGSLAFLDQPAFWLRFKERCDRRFEKCEEKVPVYNWEDCYAGL